MYLRCVIVAGFAGFVSACGENLIVPLQPPGPRDSVVNAVTVVPAEVSLGPGQTIPLAVSVNAGSAVTDRSVVWSSSDTTVATVSASGVVTAGRVVGRATISAVATVDRTKRGTSAIQVVAP